MTRLERCRIGLHKWRRWVRTDGTRSSVEWCFRCHVTTAGRLGCPIHGGVTITGAGVSVAQEVFHRHRWVFDEALEP
jgi:hypothetical protein